MWSFLSSIIGALVEVFLGEAVKLAARPDTIISTPDPVLRTLNPGGAVDDADLVACYHRVYHQP